MLIEEVILTTIVDAVIGYAFDRSSDKIGDWARDKLGLDSTMKRSRNNGGKTNSR